MMRDKIEWFLKYASLLDVDEKEQLLTFATIIFER